MNNIEMLALGHIAGLFRYPVKSMIGTPVVSIALGWHGLEGDRRFAFRRLTEKVPFPWLTAGRLPALLLYEPLMQGDVLTHLRTPDGRVLEIYSEELRQEVAQRCGQEVELMQIKHGIFDEATVSVINASTIHGLTEQAGMELDQRRFRPNILLETTNTELFNEDAWVGGTLVFGEATTGAAVSVTLRDLRCNMINLDPDTAEQNPAALKAVARLNEGNAGVYGTVVRTGLLSVGQPVWLRREVNG